jgi:hypothetical protein
MLIRLLSWVLCSTNFQYCRAYDEITVCEEYTHTFYNHECIPDLAEHVAKNMPN